ncbi:MFS transporter [Acinetobacter calcoaceticus]|uniref:Major facilitator transporter n=1 Tax=Acinetobacter oleivorans TaxID=1148157 RepID=A0A0B2UAQ1_9GAMM|nr:MFS transporter [Acinetobacter calcoaceticus]KHN66254.1 major facilitator transporter [Acinetobacter oleivorans]KUM11822.1 MFS transporter [Acinetobacter calcoaceticus]
MDTDIRTFSQIVKEEKKVVSTKIAFYLVTSLFFMWGFSHSLLDVLNKHFQDLLHISHGESAFIQTAYFSAYFLIALPIGMFMQRFGYKAGVIVGLALFALGALLFLPAGYIGTFSAFLSAIFVLACGLACLEVGANLYAAELGDPSTAAQRLTLAQGFNGLGGFFGPIVGGAVFFAPTGHFLGIELEPTSLTYVALAIVVFILLLVFVKAKLPVIEYQKDETQISPTSNLQLFKVGSFRGALLAQFCYVGAYFAIGAFFINFALDHWQGLTTQKAAYILSIGMLAYMIGRFGGSLIMRFIDARKLMVFNCLMSIILCGIAMTGTEMISIFAVVSIYLFMSTMYPTIFAMGVRNLGTKTKLAGSILVMMLIGGAVIPVVMGYMSDMFGTAIAFIVPLICFSVIGMYGISQKKQIITLSK